MYTAKGRLDNSSLIKQYSPLVRRLAHQMVAKLPANVEVDDLIQVGLIGLTDAFNKMTASITRLSPEINRTAVALDVLQRQATFAQQRYPQHVGALLEMLEAFGEELAKSYG
jgi:hypothetical protein